MAKFIELPAPCNGTVNDTVENSGTTKQCWAAVSKQQI